MRTAQKPETFDSKSRLKLSKQSRESGFLTYCPMWRNSFSDKKGLPQMSKLAVITMRFFSQRSFTYCNVK